MIKTFTLNYKVDGKTPTVNNNIYTVDSFKQKMTKAISKGLWLVDSIRESYKKTFAINVEDCIGKVIKYTLDDDGVVTFEIDCNDTSYTNDIIGKCDKVSTLSLISPTEYRSLDKPGIVDVNSVICLYLDCLTPIKNNMTKKFYINVDTPNKNGMIYPKDIITKSITEGIFELPKGIPVVKELISQDTPFFDPNSGGIEKENIVGNVINFDSSIIGNKVDVFVECDDAELKDGFEIVPIGWTITEDSQKNKVKQFQLIGFTICKTD